MLISRALVCASMLGSPVHFSPLGPASAFDDVYVVSERIPRHPNEPCPSAQEIAAVRCGFDDPADASSDRREARHEPKPLAAKTSIFTRWAIYARRFEEKFKEGLRARAADIAVASRIDARRQAAEKPVATAEDFYDTEAHSATRELAAPSELPPAPVGSPPILSLSDGRAFAVAPQGPTGVMFQIANSGGRNASLFYGLQLSGPFAFRGGKYPGVGGTCGRSLKPSATCTIVVSSRPALASEDDVLTMRYFDGEYTQTIRRSVVGAAE